MKVSLFEELLRNVLQGRNTKAFTTVLHHAHFAEDLEMLFFREATAKAFTTVFGVFITRILPKISGFFREATAKAFTTVFPFMLFTTHILPKISLFPAFVAGFATRPAQHRPSAAQ